MTCATAARGRRFPDGVSLAQRRGAGLATVAALDGTAVGLGDAGFSVGFGTVAVGFGGAGFSVGLATTDLTGAVVGARLSVGCGDGGTGVAVAGTPASERGRSRTTASSVGSGVGWVMASMSAACERGAPPPQAVHARTNATSTTARTRVQLRMQGLRSS